MTFQVAKAETGEPAQEQAAVSPRRPGLLAAAAAALGSMLWPKSRESKHKKLSPHAQKLRAEARRKKQAEQRRIRAQQVKDKYTMDKWSASAFPCPTCKAKGSQPCSGWLVQDDGYCEARPGVRGGSKRSRMAG